MSLPIGRPGSNSNDSRLWQWVTRCRRRQENTRRGFLNVTVSKRSKATKKRTNRLCLETLDQDAVQERDDSLDRLEGCRCSLCPARVNVEYGDGDCLHTILWEE